MNTGVAGKKLRFVRFVNEEDGSLSCVCEDDEGNVVKLHDVTITQHDPGTLGERVDVKFIGFKGDDDG